MREYEWNRRRKPVEAIKENQIPRGLAGALVLLSRAINAAHVDAIEIDGARLLNSAKDREEWALACRKSREAFRRSSDAR
jgi:hypothetical protein